MSTPLVAGSSQSHKKLGENKTSSEAAWLGMSSVLNYLSPPKPRGRRGQSQTKGSNLKPKGRLDPLQTAAKDLMPKPTKGD